MPEGRPSGCSAGLRGWCVWLLRAEDLEFGHVGELAAAVRAVGAVRLEVRHLRAQHPEPDVLNAGGVAARGEQVVLAPVGGGELTLLSGRPGGAVGRGLDPVLAGRGA